MGLCCLVATLATAPRAFAAETITIDAGTVDGIIPAIHGTTSGPVISNTVGEEPPCGNNDPGDRTQAYIDALVPQARTHDNAEVDIQMIWIPFPNYAGEDASDPANYDWTRVDQAMAQYAAAGLEPFIRLGFGKNGTVATPCDPSIDMRTPPNDFTVFGNICKRILMHITDGWDNGTFYTVNYAEVWNEFYIAEFWAGTETEAGQLYEAVYNACKPTFPNVNFGPSVALGYTGFWDYVDLNNVPMDFVAPHNYGTRPQRFADRTYIQPNANWEALFAYYGYPTDTPIVYSEWNRENGCYNAGGNGDTIGGGTFVAASLITMAEMHPDNSTHNVIMSHLFSSRTQIWDGNGVTRGPGVGLQAYGGDMYGETPLKLSSTGGHSDPLGAGNVDFKVISGKSADNTKVNVLVAHYDVTTACPTVPGTAFTLNVDINNLPWGTGSFTWERWAHTSVSALTLEASGSGSGGSFSTAQSMNANTFELYKLVGTPGGLVYVDFTGSPGGSGTIGSPYNTMADGVSGVISGGVVRILAGSSPEIITIVKAMTLQSSVGTAVIGSAGAPQPLMTKNSGTETSSDSAQSTPDTNAAGAVSLSLVNTQSSDVEDETVLIRDGYIYAKAIPTERDSQGLRILDTGSPLAVRLRSDEPIDESSVVGYGIIGTYSIKAVSDSDAGDIWVIMTPDTDIEASVTVSAQGLSSTGSVIGSGLHSFASAQGSESAIVPALPHGGLDTPMVIVPQQVYSEPQRIYLPVADNTDLETLSLYYYHTSENEDGQGWYPSVNVIGWTVENSTELIEDNGQLYYTILINHGAIIQLGN